MLTKTINYTDFNGEERTESFYFNLTKAELAELNLTTEGGLQEVLRKIIDARNVPELTKWFKKIILMSYGEKSPDGRRFVKNEELTEEFTQTEAYSELFMELITDSDAASAFINGLLPAIPDPETKNIPAPPVKKGKA